MKEQLKYLCILLGGLLIFTLQFFCTAVDFTPEHRPEQKILSPAQHRQPSSAPEQLPQEEELCHHLPGIPVSAELLRREGSPSPRYRRMRSGTTDTAFNTVPLPQNPFPDFCCPPYRQTVIHDLFSRAIPARAGPEFC